MSAGPPDTLTEALELSPSDWDAKDVYHLLTGLVVPRPIGWISTVSSEGVHNVAPYSYFNAMGAHPPVVAFASTGRKDTFNYVEQTREFVWNIVTMDVIEEMNFTSTDFPTGEDEFKWSGMTPVDSTVVKPKRVKEAKAHFECKVREIVNIGNNWITLGEVVHIHVDPSVWKDGRVDPELLDPVCRLSGSWYGSLGDLYKIPRPTWPDVEGTNGPEKMPSKGKNLRTKA